jgi:hypothetical protein
MQRCPPIKHRELKAFPTVVSSHNGRRDRSMMAIAISIAAFMQR